MEAIVPERPYTVEDVGILLGVRESAVRTWIRKGRLKASRPGRSYMVLGSFLLEMLSKPAEPKTRKGRKASPVIQGITG